MKFFMEMKEVIVGVTKEDMELGLKRPSTIYFTTMENVLMVTREVDTGNDRIHA